MIEKFFPILVISFFLNIFFAGIYSATSRNFSGYSFLAIIPFFLIIAAIYGLYVKTYIQRYYYDCGDAIITIQKRVFTPTEIHVQYQKIQDVYVDQDLLDRILGIYDVHIASATFSSGIEAHIDGVDKSVADNIKNFLLAKIQNKETAHHKTQASTQVKEEGSTNGSAPAVSSHHPSTASHPPSHGSENISSKTYPISDKWLTVATINSAFMALYFALIFGFVFGGAFVRNSSRYSRYESFDFGGIIWTFIIIFVVVLIGGYVRNVIWKKNFYFELTPDFVLRRTSVLSTHETHLPYKSIQDVILKQGIIEKMFGLGTVVIQNAAQGGMMPMRGSIFTMAAAQARMGVAIPGLPYEKARELSDTLNEIVRKKGDASQSMGV